jgi:hypothetical protein
MDQVENSDDVIINVKAQIISNNAFRRLKLSKILFSNGKIKVTENKSNEVLYFDDIKNTYAAWEEIIVGETSKPTASAQWIFISNGKTSVRVYFNYGNEVSKYLRRFFATLIFIFTNKFSLKPNLGYVFEFSEPEINKIKQSRDFIIFNKFIKVTKMVLAPGAIDRSENTLSTVYNIVLYVILLPPMPIYFMIMFGVTVEPYVEHYDFSFFHESIYARLAVFATLFSIGIMLTLFLINFCKPRKFLAEDKTSTESASTFLFKFLGFLIAYELLLLPFQLFSLLFIR